jgi:hypothetical protein
MDTQISNKENSKESQEVVHVKKPKRILHCSDGIYEGI